jgi:nucleoside-diphosphate-sugar epimerase
MAVIGILGANGQIGRGLALELGRNREHRLRLYVRRPDEFTPLAVRQKVIRPGVDEVISIDRFEAHRHDAVINAAGDGERGKQLALGRAIFDVTETLDRRVTEHLRENPDTLYFFLSTGAVYGFDARWPVRPGAELRQPVGDPDPVLYYPLAKLAAEARHRNLPNFKIYDLRIFGYFSRFIRLEGSFFLSELAAAVAARRPFRTTRTDMVRDYIDQAELGHVIETFLRRRPANGPYDLYSREPVGKLELLDAVSREFGMVIEYESTDTPATAIRKPESPSECRAARNAGYTPLRGSLELVTSELQALQSGLAG